LKTEEFDCAVVGLGAIGSAAVYWLARAGLSVVGLEQFECGHTRGASHDHSRIIRRSYHTPAYVRLAGLAYDAWAEVEREGREQLVFRTGGLDLGPADDPTGELEDNAAAMLAAGVPFERLEAGEIMRRWPAWHVKDSTVGLWQEDSGIVAAERAGEVMRRLAVERGANLRERARVESVLDAGGNVTVRMPDGNVRARAVVLCTDAWTNDVLRGLDATLPLRVTQEQVVYFDSGSSGRFDPSRFPIWIWLDEPGFYGVPTFGRPGVKVGQDVGGKDVAPDARTFDVDEDAFNRVARFVRGNLPGAGGDVLAVKSCLYTLTPDRDFVVDSVPGHPRVFVGLGAAHGFKFASLLGRILSDLVADGGTECEIDPFRFDRTALAGAVTC
jgi:sarcosine oxidase